MIRYSTALLLALTTACAHAPVSTSPAPAEPSRRSVDVGGVSVSYELTGPSAANAPVVVLIHGFGASMESWSDILPAIARDHRVLRLDLKGFGESGKPRDDRYSVHDEAAIVVGTLKALSIDRSILVGHSFGGAVAYLSYLRLRDDPTHRVAGLALFDAAIYDQGLPFFVVSLRNPILRWFGNTFTSAKWRARFTLERVFEVDSMVTAERVQRYAKYLDAPGSRYAFRKVAEQIVPPDADEIARMVRTIAVPSLIVWGAKDPVIDVSFARRLQIEIPNATLSIIEDTGHVPQEERPFESATILRRFLESIPR
jgi:pimeloyl-ACP methyl ester carboxylesterase